MASRSTASRSTRLTITAVLTVAVLAVAAFAVSSLWDSAKKHLTSTTCKAASYELDPGQASVAATMVGAVTRYKIELPARASVLVLAAALQESKLTNIPPGSGDRDSVGVLQQRPSQDWGKVDGGPNTTADKTKRLTDVGFATTAFLDRLLRTVPNWQTMPLADAVQAVQVSADGSLYAQHEPLATAFANALSGRTAAGISCQFDKPTKVAAAQTVAGQVSKELGIDTPVASDARTVRVPGAGWQTVAWFVANADRLGIDEVDYAGKRWTRDDGWKTAATVPATAVVATMAKV